MEAPIHVTTEIKGHILLIGLHRPEKMNAFDIILIEQLAQAYVQLEEDPSLRCGLLFAHGENFTAGLDLQQVAPVIMQGKDLIPTDSIDPWGITTVRKRSKPMVCAVQGRCLTLGIELALACDIIVAASNTVFAQIEIKRGIFPFGGATIRMPQRVGWGNAMRYLLTGDDFDAQTAYRIGMVQELTEPGAQLDKALSIAQTIAEQAPLGVVETIRSSRAVTETLFNEDTKNYFRDTIVRLMNTKDAQEGMMSFIQRRKAVFEGK
jgi:enoyl-CoA hydratase